MELELSGRVAMVTGASRGIGAEIALALAREGCDVAINHVGDAEAATVVGRAINELGRRCFVRESDVSDSAAAEAMFGATEAMLGPPEIVVCNAGITRDAVVWKMDDEAWEAVLGVNLRGCFNYNRALGRRLRDRSKAGEAVYGRIVNVTSINGLRGKFGQANYAASKGGMIALTKTVARELGRFGVTVNAVAPGMVLTPMARDLPKPVLDAARGETVLGRIADPADVADLVTFLCSARARHITGQVLQVDGGQYI